MKKYNLLFLLFFAIANQALGQGIFEKIKNSYLDQLSQGQILLKVNAAHFENGYGRNLVNPTNSELLNNLSVGYIFHDALTLGVSSINSHVDIREDGFEPVHNGITLYGKIIFLEYSIFSANRFESVGVLNNYPILRNIYFSMSRPFGKNRVHNFSENQSIRIGFGLRYKIYNRFNADINYNRLLDAEINQGHHKGILSLGFGIILF
jgi:hypothetical protein